MSTDSFTAPEPPIDVMPLMHKAFRAVSDRAEAMAAAASTMEEIAELNETFAFWIKQITYHAAVEDEVMTGPLETSQPGTTKPNMRNCPGRQAIWPVSLLWAKPRDWKRALGRRPFPWIKNSTISLKRGSTI